MHTNTPYPQPSCYWTVAHPNHLPRLKVSASSASATSAVASRFHGTDISQDPIGGESTSTYRNGRPVEMGAVSQTATHPSGGRPQNPVKPIALTPKAT
ncbi:hypothetical protein [Eikenella sp. NML03-A-027]|uniref:hypothetical protein n=1 Tax=Eikenella sp. NML03-A-027 TaxID=1795828 RepID=UPI000AF36024|nr:hypothetical protein [Eikenella sp. NML03-A-027]